MTRMKYPPPLCFSNHKDCTVQDTSEAGALLFLCTPSLFFFFWLGGGLHWGTFLGCSSSSSTLGINPLQLCPLLHASLPPSLPPRSPVPGPGLTPAGPFPYALNIFFKSYSPVAQIEQTSRSASHVKHTCTVHVVHVCGRHILLGSAGYPHTCRHWSSNAHIPSGFVLKPAGSSRVRTRGPRITKQDLGIAQHDSPSLPFETGSCSSLHI